jgi:hypothetical protein
MQAGAFTRNLRRLVILSSAVVSSMIDAPKLRADTCTVESFSFQPSYTVFPAQGGVGYITVNAPMNCPWVITTTFPWIALSNASGVGTGTFEITVSPNTGPFRSAVLLVNGLFPAGPPVPQLAGGCQVNPLITFFHQSDAAPFVPQPYFGGKQIPACVTQNFGCALLTSSNMLRSFDNPYLASDFPSVLDDNLVANDGYDNSCGLFFDRIPQATGFFTQILGGGVVLDLDSYLDQHFCQEGDRAILRLNEYVNGSYHGSHFLLVTGKNRSDWEVFDPGWQNQNVSPSGANVSLSGHYTGFTTFNGQQATFRQFTLSEVRLFSTTQIANPGSLSITAQSPVELLLTDPQGNRLGNQGGNDLFEVPKGSYFRDFPLADAAGTGTGAGDPSGIKTAYVAFPQDGAYRISTLGTSLGTYTLTFRQIGTNGATQEVTTSGVTNIGAIAQYQYPYASVPSQTFTVLRIATFESTLADIANSLQLGLIDNSGIANSLSQKIQAAAQATGDGRAGILNAFNNEVNAQAEKHIIGAAIQTLLQDVTSLLVSFG